MLIGILRIRWTGAPWRDLPARYGPWQTVYGCLRRWQRAGAWERLMREVQVEAAHDEPLDGSLTVTDCSSFRTHQHAAGTRKKETLAANALDAAGAASAATCT